jgi:hypothetical protein
MLSIYMRYNINKASENTFVLLCISDDTMTYTLSDIWTTEIAEISSLKTHFYHSNNVYVYSIPNAIQNYIHNPFM